MSTTVQDQDLVAKIKDLRKKVVEGLQDQDLVAKIKDLRKKVVEGLQRQYILGTLTKSAFHAIVVVLVKETRDQIPGDEDNVEYLMNAMAKDLGQE